MSDPQFDVERATAGLVIALFLASALLIAGMLLFILRDMEERAQSSGSEQAVRVERAPATASRAPAPSPVPEVQS